MSKIHLVSLVATGIMLTNSTQWSLLTLSLLTGVPLQTILAVSIPMGVIVLAVVIIVGVIIILFFLRQHVRASRQFVFQQMSHLQNEEDEKEKDEKEKE